MPEPASVVDAGINFSHPAIPQQQPAPVAEAAPANEPAPTATPTEPKRKFAQKYETVEELEKGYWNSSQEAARISTENKTLKELLVAQQRVNPAERAEARDKFEDELREAAIPLDALDAYINKRTQRAVKDAWEPILRGAQARNDVIKQFPDFVETEPVIEQFLAANPEVNDEYQGMINAGLERAAFKYAHLQFRMANPTAKPITDASGQEQAVARATAGLSSGQAGSREVVDAQAKSIADANARFQVDGDERRLAQSLADVFKPLL